MELLFPLLIVFFLVTIFLNFRKQKKTVAKTTQLQDSLKPGDEVLTTAGLYATVVAVVGDTVDLEISNGVITTWSRAVVREVLVDSEDDDDSELENDADLSSGTALTAEPDAFVVDDKPTDPPAPRLTKD